MKKGRFLPYVLAGLMALPSFAHSEQRAQPHTSKANLEQKVGKREILTEAKYTYSELTNAIETAKEGVRELQGDLVIGGNGGLKLKSNLYPDEDIWYLSLRLKPNSRAVTPGFLSTKNKNIYIIHEGLIQEAEGMLEGLNLISIAHPRIMNYALPDLFILKKQFPNYNPETTKTKEGKDKFLAELIGTYVKNDGLFHRVLRHERFHRLDSQEYSPAEREARALCNEMIDTPFFGLAGAYRFRSKRVVDGPHQAAAEDFFDFYFRQMPSSLEEQTPEEIRSIAEKYAKNRFPKDYKLILSEH